MPRYQVRVEYALAFDLDIEIDARDRQVALGAAQDAIDNAGIWRAILDEFAGHNPSIAGGDLVITDVAVRGTIRQTPTRVA